MIESEYSTIGQAERMIRDKMNFHESRITDLASRIRERLDISALACESMEQRQCDLGTHLLAIDARDVGPDPQLERLRMQIEDSRGRIESDSFREKVACWKDVERLKESTVEALKEYNQTSMQMEVVLGKPVSRRLPHESLDGYLQDGLDPEGLTSREPEILDSSDFRLRAIRRIP